MKIYITKNPHTKYGSIKLSTYKSIEDLINNSYFWFDKPSFSKPLICDFTQQFYWRGFNSRISGTSGKIKYFPEGEVKEKIKEVVRNSIKEDFYETINNRHYKWIGEIDVEIIERNTSGNFNLYLTKPCIHGIQFAGMDRAILWLDYPILKTCNMDNKYFKYKLIEFTGNASISGKFFRKNDEMKSIGLKFWDAIVNSFDVDFKDMDEFYQKINDNNHKKGMSDLEFIQEFYFDIKLK